MGAIKKANEASRQANYKCIPWQTQMVKSPICTGGIQRNLSHEALVFFFFSPLRTISSKHL